MAASVWQVIHTIGVGVAAYVLCLLILRVAGKRTLSKWNAFDFIVTVALGSSLATAVLSGQVSVAVGVAGFATLVALQFVVTWTSVRVQWWDRMVKSTPVLLLENGDFRASEMRRERVTEGEVLAAIRSQGYAELSEVGSRCTRDRRQFQRTRPPASFDVSGNATRSATRRWISLWLAVIVAAGAIGHSSVAGWQNPHLMRGPNIWEPIRPRMAAIHHLR